MTALTTDKQRQYRLPTGGLETRQVRLAGYTNFGGGNTAHTVYKGAVVVCDVSDTDGYFSAAQSGGKETGDIFGGIAMERQVIGQNDLADGVKVLKVAIDGEWAFDKGSLTLADIGASIYASDDNTITTTATNNFLIGHLVDVDDVAWVDISGYTRKPLA